MTRISIDLETFSSVDLSKGGVYKYAEAPDFEVLLFGYSADGGPVRVVDLASGERLPEAVLDALTDPDVEKWAFNASFERVCLSRYLRDLGRPVGPDGFISPEGWRCTMVWSAYLGLPLSLAEVGAALGLEKQKLSEGKELIRLFCKPCVPTLTNWGQTRNGPASAPDEWARFRAYNLRDVETEAGIQERLARFPVPDEVWAQYRIDQEINDRGIGVDLRLADSAIAMDARAKAVLTARAQALTDLDNPGSAAQMKEWLAARGVDAESLGKKDVAALIKTAPPAIRDALELRLQLAKSSVKKYAAMKATACADGRCRGMFQFYGANRTGRWSGRSVQLQNLPQNHMPDLEAARRLVRAGDYDSVETLYGSVPDVLSELIRTAFVPAEGRKFIVADYSAIEARVIAWLAGETWRTEVFKSGGDIYCASASQMFKVPVVKHGVNGHLRQKGKIAELALGYGGGVGALTAMGALEMGLKEDELKPLVDVWRESNTCIVRLWRTVEEAAKTAITDRTETHAGALTFEGRAGMMFVTLPSGRRLSYVKPALGTNRFGNESITYMGVGAAKKWERLETFGGKLVENAVQAISRDVLCCAMQELREQRIVAHVHDELIIEAEPETEVGEICERMARTPVWAEGLVLRADGYECEFYKKD